MSNSPETVVDYTIDALREAIRIGRLAPGQRLVVADVSRMLSVSAGPIREAIRRLTGEGLVEIVPHRGAIVKSIDVDDLREIYQLREVIEGLAARTAAEHVDHGDYRARLTAMVGEMEALAKTENVGDWLVHNRAFHDLVYQMGESERLRTLATQLTMPMYQLRLPHGMTAADLRTSHADHKLVADAILRGEGPVADRMMRNHVRNAGIGLIEAVSAMRRPGRPVER